MSPRKEKIRPVFEAQVEKLDAEGRGVARRDGKVVFIQGALPGETVTYEQIRNKPSYEIGIVKEILTASELRVEPACPNFGIGPGTCGGCVMQHLDARAQVDFKQTVLTDALWHIGKVTPESILPPIVGEFWGYRHRSSHGAQRRQKGWDPGGLSRKELKLRRRHDRVPHPAAEGLRHASCHARTGGKSYHRRASSSD